MKKKNFSKAYYAIVWIVMGVSSSCLFAQNVTIIKGTVKDGSTLRPLSGVAVSSDNTSTSTNNDGFYELNTSPNGTITISLVGYAKQHIAVNGRNEIHVQLELQSKELDAVVVIGYGSTKKSDLTGSVASIKGEAIKELPVSSIDQVLQARAPGIQATQSSSAPGGGVSVRVRGSNSINSGSEPLYVIDGFPIYPDNTAYGFNADRQPGNALSSVNPNDIVSIEVLKDASATSIYGSRGSNGVVLITTKRGKSGESRISYDGSFSTQVISNTVKVMNAAEYAKYLNLLEKSQGGNPVYTDDQITALGDGTNWLDAITRNGSFQNHQLTFYGGSQHTKYALSGNYTGNEGILKNTNFSRYGFRLNLDNEAFGGRLKIASSWTYSRVVSNNAPTDRGGPGGLIITALGLDPTVPIRDASGDFSLPSYDNRFYTNPLQELENVVDRDEIGRLFGSTSFTVHIINGLDFKTSIGVDAFDGNNITFYPQKISRLGRQYNGQVSNANRSIQNILNENILSYNTIIGKHHKINAVIGYTYQNETNRLFSIGVRNTPANSVDVATLQTGAQILSPTSSRSSWTLASLLARVNYTYKDLYLLTLTIRRDGSSKFGSANKWANFPSFAVGWKVSNEPFFKKSVLSHAINQLKLRVSYGITGNSQIPVYQSLNNLNPYNYVFNNKFVSGLADQRISNPNLKWESTGMFDVGLDLSLFQNRVNIVADYFYNKTEDLLLNVALAKSIGFESVLKNSGSLENTGFELAIDATAIQTKDFTWSVAGNISILRNKILDLGGTSPFFSTSTSGHLGVDGSWVAPGNPIGVWRGYRYIGIFQSQEEINNKAHRSGDKPGYPIYEDTNGDGVITPDDYQIIGNPNPDLMWGFTTTLKYKKFDLNIFIRGVQGFEIRNLQQSEMGDGVQRLNELAGMTTSSWSPTNPTATRPVIDASRDFANSFRDSDYFVEDGSFIRLQNVVIGYTLPTLKWISRARVYVSAQNVFTITKYTGFDPEVNNRGQDNLNRGDDYDAYPRSRMYTIGVNLEF